MLRCAVREFDSGRYVDELRGIPGVGQPRGGERDEGVQPVDRGVRWRCALEELDPAFDLVKFGAPMTHQRGRAPGLAELVASSTTSRHALTPPPLRWLPVSHVVHRRL